MKRAPHWRLLLTTTPSLSTFRKELDSIPILAIEMSACINCVVRRGSVLRARLAVTRRV
jgi:hypothetical protein